MPTPSTPNLSHIKRVKDYLELDSIEVEDSCHLNSGSIFTRIDRVATVDCEGDSVPMIITTVVTPHYTTIRANMGAMIATVYEEGHAISST